jgi:hypothetical protein
VLLERVKRQIADRDNPASQIDSPKRPVAAMIDMASLRIANRPAPFER